MKPRFTIIEGGAARSPADSPVSWRVDLRRANAVRPEEIDAWRALLVRASDPVEDRSVYADPDFLLSVAQHQAGGRDIVFALAWATADGRNTLNAVVPLALPHTLWGHGRIVPWQPQGVALGPIHATHDVEALRDALTDALRRIRPRDSLALDMPAGPAPQAAPRIRAVARRERIPAQNLVGIRPLHAPAPIHVERISEPHRIRDAVEAFLLHDAEVSAAPIIGDPSEAALVRVVTRLFARRRQVTVALARRDDRIVSVSISLGAGPGAVIWRLAEGEAAPDRIDRSA